MKNLLIGSVVAFALVLLSACNFEVETDVYVSDIRDVAKIDSYLMTSTTMAIEFISKDQCEDNKREIADILSRYVSNVSIRDCVESGFNSFLVIDAEIPIMSNTVSSPFYLFAIVTVPTDTGTKVYLSVDQQNLNALNNQMYSKYFQNLQLSESRIRVIVKNDSETEMLTASGVFVNDYPVDESRFYELNRRAEIEITLSSVGSAHLENEGYVLAFILQN